MIRWTDSTHCRPDAMNHCDWCPYVLGRPRGDGDALPLHTDDGRGIEDHYEPPAGGLCPHGVRWQGARQARVERLVGRVRKGTVSLHAALTAAEGLGLELDA